MLNFCCPQCKTQYRFPESRAGEKFACGKCNQRLQVPNPSVPAKPAPSSPQLGTVVGQPIRTAPPAAPQTAVVRPLPAPSEPKTTRKVKQWYYEYRGEVVGPVPEKDLRVAAENDTLVPDARVWTEGMADWQPAIAVLPRVFDGLDSEPGFGFQKTMAVVLATLAFASLVILGGVYWNKGRKSADPAKQDVVKASPAPAPAPNPAPAPVQPVAVVNPAPAPKTGPGPTTPPGPGPAPAPANLNAAQIMTRFGPSVAFVQTDLGTGSGFLMGDGLVVTNSHVVEKSLSKNIRVAFPSSAQPEQLIPATLVYEDAARDLAVLEVKTASLAALKLAADATPGEDVVVIGSPGTAGGEVAKNSVTRGVFSSIDEKTFGQKFFIIDASINPGNSGGPVFNSRGEVIGVVTQFIPGKQHLNYIVPFPEVEKALAKAKGPGAGELIGLARRHDAKAVAARLMVGVLLDDTIQRRYVAVMAATLKQKKPHGPAVLAVKKEWLGPVQTRTKLLVAADVLETANRLAGTGADSADIATRDPLRKLLVLYSESQKLAASPEDDSVANYIDRQEDTTKRFNELVETIPKGLGLSKNEFMQLVGGTFKSIGGSALSPDP